MKMRSESSHRFQLATAVTRNDYYHRERAMDGTASACSIYFISLQHSVIFEFSRASTLEIKDNSIVNTRLASLFLRNFVVTPELLRRKKMEKSIAVDSLLKFSHQKRSVF